ncbi:MAG: TetR/AcrR family transcriptional regulator [Alphaproteobacteria bacterium]|nr:MAG: TetR/AcrR family transcriptional regulator [Alphaproteobacteria bacterium]
MSANSREAVLQAARRRAQAHGYNGLNFRDLAAEVGIKSASLYYYFPSKADLGAAVARRYWEDSEAELEALSRDTSDPTECLFRYPDLFRRSLASDNRICLCSFMAAEYDDLPPAVTAEVGRFADVNISWLAKRLAETGLSPQVALDRAGGIFAAIAGAQLMARGRADIDLFDRLIQGYREAGLLPLGADRL